MIIKYTDIELQSLKEELSKLEIKLQSLSDKKNEYLRDIEDFNLQYNLYLGELIENILRLKKDILYKKNSQKRSEIGSENYEEIKNTISQIESALYKLENSLKTFDKDDMQYTETFNLYNQLKVELENLINQKDEIEEQIYSFKDSEDYDWGYTSAKHEYEEYYHEYSNIKEDIENSIILNNQEKLEIKSLWRKACKLCHPDIVADDLKEKAHEVMKTLNEAYSKKDIEKVKAILHDLEHGLAFEIQSNSINDLDLLNTKISEYKEQIKSLELEIQKIKNDTTFKIISQENNWNNHFQKIKQNLKEEKEKLKNQLFQLIKEEKNKFDLYVFSNHLVQLKTKREFESYLESSFLEMENFFDSKKLEETKEIELDLEKILYDLQSNNFIAQINSQIINAFLILLAQQFEKISHIKLMRLILNFLPECGIKKRIEASLHYLIQDNVPKVYFENFHKIISLLSDSVNEDENNVKASNVFFQFYTTAYNYFYQNNDQNLLNLFNQLFIKNESKYSILNNNKVFLNEILTHANIDYEKPININQFLLEDKITTSTCEHLEDSIIIKEESEYSKKLYGLDNITFEDIKNISSNYINYIGNPDELFYQLNRGIKIIDNTELLYKYIQSFGRKHKAKLYSAYDEIFDTIKNKKMNIIDWGCGQAFATMILLDYAKNKRIQLDISNIVLIEPSKLALSRGILHIDVLKQLEYNIKAINCEIDCIKESDIYFDDDYFTLHLFSNILDIEDFNMSNLLHKISSKIKSENLFICVSPKINDKRNNRLDLFYKHFDENFDTSLISGRDTDIDGHTRYEKVFEVKYTKTELIEEKRHEVEKVEKEYHLDVIQELDKYSNYVVPILNIKILEDSISTDPEYIIFKIRKVAEMLTTKIYSNYEENAKQVSFYDKIRYLSSEKKIFDKTITNYVQTIRTIGNRGVHEEDRDVSKQKLDAHLMVIALVSFLNELTDKKLLK